MSSPQPTQPAQAQPEQTPQTTESTMPTPETETENEPKPTDTHTWTHVLFDIKASPKKLSPVLLESLHHKLHRSDVKVYSSFDVLRAAGPIKRGNVVFAIPAAGRDAEQIVLAVRAKVQHLIMDWDTNELSGEGLGLVVDDGSAPWGWGVLPYWAWKEQRRRSRLSRFR